MIIKMKSVIVLLAKDECHRNFNFQGLIDSYISHGKFVSMNNVLISNISSSFEVF